ncbi:MAG: hypothetical protein ACREID_10385 [Planctomycetota bacterium]
MAGRPWFRVPLLFRFYRSKRRCPPSCHRKRTELASEMVRLLASWLSCGRRLPLTRDAEYACQTVVRRLPAPAIFTGPMTMNAALHALPGAYRGHGRPRVVATLCGRPVSLLVFTRTCPWYHVAGTRLVRVVVTKDARGRLAPRAFFCTDSARPAVGILTALSRRWALEVAFRDAKQSLGLEDPQNGWWRRRAGRRGNKTAGTQPLGRRGEHAVRRTLPFVFAVHALALV